MTLFAAEDIRNDSLRQVAARMLIAAQTAPKARGQNRLATAFAAGDTIAALSQKMAEIGATENNPTFARDAENIRAADVIVLLGTRISPMNLTKCGWCGFDNCAQKPDATPCAFNTGDLGIALGSAVSVATDNRVDNRVMYTVGLAAMSLDLLGPGVRVAYGIPLSATAKNPFFDRPK